MSSLLDDVNELLRQNQGDLGRLQHIKKTLEANKTLYVTDRQYVTTLTGKLTKDNTPKVHSTEHIRNSERSDDELYSENNNLRGSENTDTSSNNFETSSNIPIENSFCGNCGNNMGSNSFCSKCGQSHTPSKLNSFCGNCGNVKNKNEQCQICNNKNNSKGKTSKKIGKIILYLLGLMVIIIGTVFFAYSMDMPAIFAGQYLMLSLFILVIGGILVYAGKRIKSN